MVNHCKDCEPGMTYLELAISVDQQVSRLEISMQNVGRVNVLMTKGDDRERDIQRTAAKD